MTKTELQSALAEATEKDKRTAGAFLDTLSTLAYKEIKKNGEFVLPGFGKLVKRKRPPRPSKATSSASVAVQRMNADAAR
jgi:DNA-binding protein HU-beta